ncbi:renalase-like [Lolium rigidum]|uniref:renalase-like n=1 Tax=Lolium rigidum TaxID=89674 RepID=UPI001F5CA968|nr:renalase-like [Lolium rigidum]
MPPSLLLHRAPCARPGPARAASRLSASVVSAANGAGGSRPPKPRPPPRGKPRFSRQSAIRKSFQQEQVVFSTPVPADPTVAVIGGGASGLACASALAARGVRSVVFDTGKHGLGGRLATRTVHEERRLVFDHAAQFFTASDERFRKLVDEWVDRGLVREWTGSVGELQAGGQFTPTPSSTPRYIGVNGMRPLADALLPENDLVKVVRPSWISKLEPFNGLWRLFENEKPQGQYDAIVIAHNGKCSNRLLSTSGLPQLTKQMKRLDLSSVWALLAAFEDPLPIPHNSSHGAFEGAFVRDVDSLSWMANNTRKLFPLEADRPECWTFFSTASYGRKNKVPQENIPNATAEKVKREMLGGVELALGLSKGSLQLPFYTRVQLWGAALPMNTPGVPCIFDPQGRAGICGDWLTGSSIEAAVLSGMSLGDHVADYFASRGERPEEFAIGLDDSLIRVEGHDIGQFPGLDSQKPQVAEPQLTLSI